MNQPDYIFVYGTLKRGYSNAFLLERECEFVAKATVPYKMFAYVREGVAPRKARIVSAPMLSREPGICHGEVWRLPSDKLTREDLLRRLDWLEGVEYGWYTREVIEVPGQKDFLGWRENGVVCTTPCFVYFHNAPGGTVFEDWSDRG